MGKQHDSASDLSVLTLVHSFETSAAQQRLESNGQLDKTEARAEATLDATTERNPRVGRRTRVEESLRPELVRIVIGFGV